MRGGTYGLCILHTPRVISIHPPHAGRDRKVYHVYHGGEYFNPPSPCGEGQLTLRHHHKPRRFQSTLPMRGGTESSKLLAAPYQISIHPPHAGRDLAGLLKRLNTSISIHPPHTGRDFFLCQLLLQSLHFNPPSPCGEGHSKKRNKPQNNDFNPPSPCGEGPKYQYPVSCRVISIHPPHAGRDPDSIILSQ